MNIELIIEAIVFLICIKFTLDYIGTTVTYYKTQRLNNKFASISCAVSWAVYYYLINN